MDRGRFAEVEISYVVGPPNALPFSKPAAESASPFYTDVPAAGLSAAMALWVLRSEFDPRGSSARIEAGHAPAEYEYATAST